jgi:hypothetical protein
MREPGPQPDHSTHASQPDYGSGAWTTGATQAGRTMGTGAG